MFTYHRCFWAGNITRCRQQHVAREARLEKPWLRVSTRWEIWVRCSQRTVLTPLEHNSVCFKVFEMVILTWIWVKLSSEKYRFSLQRPVRLAWPFVLTYGFKYAQWIFSLNVRSRPIYANEILLILRTKLGRDSDRVSPSICRGGSHKVFQLV